MTQAGYTHFSLICDRTGSMADPADPGALTTKAQVATKGVARFIRDQAAQPGRTTWSLTQFDTQFSKERGRYAPAIERVAWFSDTPPAWACEPRNGTPLLDAVAITVRDTGEHLAGLAEDQRPERVYVIVATDGLENSSEEYRLDQVKLMVTEQREKYGWEFVFIGADIDAFAAGGGMGMAQGSTLHTNSAHQGAMAAAYAGTSSAVTRSRAGGQSVQFSKRERKMSDYGDDASTDDDAS